MPCLRIDLHRMFPIYVDGAASPQTVERIERHLLDCGACRARLVRLREAKSLLGELPKLEAMAFERLTSRRPASAPRARFIIPSLVRHLAADALVATMMFAAFTILYAYNAAARGRSFDSKSFRSVEVRKISTDDAHVAVQGVVAAIAGDFDEGSRRFKLTDPKDARAFIVCEILEGDALRMPKPGSRVRVWGVSRYDSSPSHRWFEIHPVLRVEILR